jgi:hypothetical protein
MRLIALERVQSLVFLVQVSESDIKYWCVAFVQVSLQNRPKFNKVWESYHNFHLAHPILVRPMALQRRHFRVLQVKFQTHRG